jgi:hypothetical protein
MYSDNMISTLNEIAQQYRSIIYQAIYAVISQPPYTNTGAGAQSLTVDVIEGNATEAPKMQILFDDHLQILGKRKIEWTKFPKMQELIAWAETKKSTEQEALQLAWSVGWKQKTQDLWKPKPAWRKKSLSSVLKEMNELVLKAFEEAIEKDLQQATKV